MDPNVAAPHQPRALWRFVLVFLLIAVIVAPAAMAAPLPLVVTISGVQVTDVRDGSFVMSWATNELSNGRSRCYDATGVSLITQVDDPVVSTTTHYVTIAGLNPNTQYRCEVESAAVIGNNEGLRYPVTTGPVINSSPAGHLVYGLVLKIDGTTIAPNTIAYLRLVDANGLGSPGRSQWVSARVENSGYWGYSLENVRTANAAQYFIYTPGSDTIELWVNGGIDGSWGLPLLPEQILDVSWGLPLLPEQIFPIPNSFPAPMPDAILDGTPLAAILDNFGAVVGDDGVLITWETVSEVGNLGFNLYRALDPAGTQNLLAFVPSQAPGSSQGFAYAWLDTDVVDGQTYFYWLETLDAGGTNMQYGPVSITYQAPTAVETTALTAQPTISSALARWLLILLTLLGGFTFKLYRQSHQSTTR